MTIGCASGHNATTFLLDDTSQPDVNLIILPDWGGASWVKDGYLHGSPELLAEISQSSALKDMTIKKDLHQKAGVQEYLAVILGNKEIHWLYLQDGVYQVLESDTDGIYRSLVFPGLWLDSNALFEGRMGQVLSTLQKGMATKEYIDFAAQLKARKK